MPFISTVSFTVPFVFINMMCTAPSSNLYSPVHEAPSGIYPQSKSLVSSPYAPTARSVTPSPSRSPMAATEWPKRSYADRSGPWGVLAFISLVSLTVPSAYINMMCTAPVS